MGEYIIGGGLRIFFGLIVIVFGVIGIYGAVEEMSILLIQVGAAYFFAYFMGLLVSRINCVFVLL